MRESQRKYDADVKQTSLASPFALMTERLGPLPLINHFVERMDPSLPEQYVPASDPRFTMSQAQALGVLLRSKAIVSPSAPDRPAPWVAGSSPVSPDFYSII